MISESEEWNPELVPHILRDAADTTDIQWVKSICQQAATMIETLQQTNDLWKQMFDNTQQPTTNTTHIKWETLKNFPTHTDALHEIEKLQKTNTTWRQLVVNIQDAEQHGITTLKDLKNYLDNTHNQHNTYTDYGVLHHTRWLETEEPKATVIRSTDGWTWHTVCETDPETANEIAESLSITDK